MSTVFKIYLAFVNNIKKINMKFIQKKQKRAVALLSS
jgi:hypothetical protein